MDNKKFDPKKLKKLNNPQRLVDIPPRYIRDRLKMENVGVIVEIGAGTAFFCKAFEVQFNPREIYACDISDTMLSWITENVTPDHPRIIAVKNGESTLPLESETADLVFMIALHHELENPSSMLAESFRILKPGGKIFIVDWKKEDMPEGPPTEIRCLPDEVGGQLTDARFKEVRIYTDLPKHFLVIAQK